MHLLPKACSLSLPVKDLRHRQDREDRKKDFFPIAAPKIMIYGKQRQNKKGKELRKNSCNIYLKALLEQKAISTEPRYCL